MSDTKKIFKATGVYLVLCLLLLFFFWLFLSVGEYISNKGKQEKDIDKTKPKVVVVESPENVVLVPSVSAISTEDDGED